MSAPCQEACGPWATTLDLCAPCTDYEVNSGLMDTCIAAASDVLFMLSGRQFAGSCSDCVRPTARFNSYGDPMWWNTPAAATSEGLWLAGGILNGRFWAGGCSCNRTDRTGCTLISEITLGGYPVTEVTKVLVDGVELDSARYRVDDFRYLVRLPDADGTPQGWPCCQDMLKASTQADTFEVTFTYCVPPPAMGKMAAAKLACELYLSCSPATVGQCQLPKRVTSITRQGVSMVVLDPMAFLDEGKTGIYEMDLFLTSVNPKGIRQAATVMSPDIPRRVRRITT
jgi:hypothetical protein